jgi:hypothetical protein
MSSLLMLESYVRLRFAGVGPAGRHGVRPLEADTIDPLRAIEELDKLGAVIRVMLRDMVGSRIENRMIVPAVRSVLVSVCHFDILLLNNVILT